MKILQDPAKSGGAYALEFVGTALDVAALPMAGIAIYYAMQANARYGHSEEGLHYSPHHAIMRRFADRALHFTDTADYCRNLAQQLSLNA